MEYRIQVRKIIPHIPTASKILGVAITLVWLVAIFWWGFRSWLTFQHIEEVSTTEVARPINLPLLQDVEHRFDVQESFQTSSIPRVRNPFR